MGLDAVLSTRKFLFIHQNFPAQFVHLAPALAALGHEVLALGTRDETPVLHGVRYCTYPFGEEPKENAPWDSFTKGLQARLARADAVAVALQQLKSQGIVPDVVIAHSGWGKAFYAKSVSSWKKVFLDEVKAHIDMERVHFVGRVPHDTLKQLLQVSTVHVYLTYPFVLSWSLLEAMSMGCLVVASDTAPVREVIHDGHNGLLTDFFDPTALAARVADALENRLAMVALKDRARQTIVERFDLQGVNFHANLTHRGCG